jgi:hypothetical protein
MRLWRGRDPEAEQVANAFDDFVDLTPVSDARAVATRVKWAALLPGTDDAPLIWERNPRGRDRTEQDFREA